MPPESEGGVFIPTRDIYEKLTVATETLHRISVQMEADRADLRDMKERLRVVERWKYAAPVANVISIASLVIAIVRA